MYKAFFIGKTKNGDNMKKVVYCLITFLLLTGCGKKKEEPVELSKLTTPLSELTTDNFAPNLVISKVETEDAKNKYRDMTEEEITDMGLDLTQLDIHIMRTLEEKVGFYYILKPKDSYVETMKTVMKKYFDTMIQQTSDADDKTKYQNHLEQIEQGFYIYVCGSKTSELMTSIEDVKEPLFESLIKPRKEELENMGLSNDMIDQSNIRISADLNSSYFYYIILPKKGKEEDIEKALKKEKEKQLEIAKDDQKKQLEDSVISTTEGVVVWISSKDNDKVLKTIQKTLKK